jgi:hypothetical protein
MISGAILPGMTEPAVAEHPAPKRRGRLIAVVVVVLRLAAAGVTAALWQPWKSSHKDAGTFALSGTFALVAPVDELNDSSGVYTHDGQCQGSGGYDDIAQATQVVISDESGTTVAVGALGIGRYDPDTTGRMLTCSFDIVVNDVPAGKSFYKVGVSRRGEQQFTESEMRTGISLHLGDE